MARGKHLINLAAVIPAAAIHSILAFGVFSVVVAVTPGPDSLLVLRNTLARGRNAGIRVASGAAAGSLIWGLACAIGIAAILAASAELYRTVQLLGACYLIVLGIKACASANAHEAGSSLESRRGRWTSGFRAGLLSNVLNPKVGLFFLAVMPQFIPHGSSPVTYSLTFAVVDSAVALSWLVALAWLGDRANAALNRASIRRLLDRIAGVVLIALGAKIALEHPAA